MDCPIVITGEVSRSEIDWSIFDENWDYFVIFLMLSTSNRKL